MTMAKLRIAFLYNVRHRYPDPNDPRSQLETDFDDPVVIQTMIKHLKAAGYHVLPIEANERAYHKLFQNRARIDLAFNYSEGIYGLDRECHIPAMLEMLRIPYLGSPPLTAALVLDKAKAKEVLIASGVSTAPFQVLRSDDQPLNRAFRYPMIVKPRSQGSSAGITNQSVVRSERELRRQVKWVRSTFGQDSIVEPFLPGREFSVGMVGNPPKILPIIEARHELLPGELERIDSLEVKWFFEEEGDGHHLSCPARMPSLLEKRVKNLCIATWNALGVRDWCRIDIRCDAKGNPFVLEVNCPAGLIPPEHSMTSYLPMAARAARIEYRKLLTLLIDTARRRLAPRPEVAERPRSRKSARGASKRVVKSKRTGKAERRKGR